ncbi:MAG: class I SAM-dependent methyltransferase [Lentisphaeraceae bacterium]|nr:class I SAM-dependent methyltransferase [Lentisphaeraceae bacterium]
MNKENKNFEEDSIRPSEMRKILEGFTQKDANWLLTRSSDFIEVNCPACNSSESTFVFDKRGFKYLKCKQCETGYISPRPNAKLLSDFYEGSQAYGYLSRVLYPATKKNRFKNLVIPRVDRLLSACEKYIYSRNTLIEVGAGSGVFCSEVQSREIFGRVIAVEPNLELADDCKELGLEVKQSLLEDISDLQADVVASFEVIEHVFNPEYFLKSLLSLLSRGGIVYLTCPNFKGFDLTTLGPLSDQVDFEHLNYFHPKSIRLLAERVGYEVLDIETPGCLDAELVRKQMEIDDQLKDSNPFLSELLFDNKLKLEFQDFLKNNLLSSHMAVTLRKP